VAAILRRAGGERLSEPAYIHTHIHKDFGEILREGSGRWGGIRSDKHPHTFDEILTRTTICTFTVQCHGRSPGNTRYSRMVVQKMNEVVCSTARKTSPYKRNTDTEDGKGTPSCEKKGINACFIHVSGSDRECRTYGCMYVTGHTNRGYHTTVIRRRRPRRGERAGRGGEGVGGGSMLTLVRPEHTKVRRSPAPL